MADIDVQEFIEEKESYYDDSLYNITSFGSDMSFQMILMMYQQGDIEKPELQRNYVWTKKEASRFIDSLLLGLPVPSIFLAKTSESKLLIVDGYQRIMTVNDYINGVFSGDNSVFKLTKADNINPSWRGKAYIELGEAQKRALRMYTIHAIIFEQKQPKNDSGMYQIFERINTGGRTLKPQEIRNCVYHGSFNGLLFELNKNQDWRDILATKEPDSRMADVELILRFFAFCGFNTVIKKQKQINLVQFLNKYMDDNRMLSDEQLLMYKDLFERTISYLHHQIGKNCFRTCKEKDGKIIWAKKVNPVVMDAVCVATNMAFDKFDQSYLRALDVSDKYVDLMLNNDFISVTKSRTTNVENINKRIYIAAKILYGIDI